MLIQFCGIQIKYAFNIIGCCLVLLFFQSCSSNLNKQEVRLRPNIVFIVADDMGPWTLGMNDDPNTYTPELDKIGKAGVVLNNCFASGAVCSPTRASLFTGRYPSETGVIDYIPQGDSIGVDLSLKMFPELIKDAGYSTVIVGKWHLGDTDKAFMPTQRGYDRFTGFPHGGMKSMSPRIQVEGEWEVAEGAYTPDLLTDYAINYIDEISPEKTGKPFLLSLHFWAPHANTEFPKGMEPKYKGRSWLPMQEVDLKHWENAEIELPEPDFPNLDVALTNRMAREYYASVHSVDRNVGRLMEKLEKLNLDENTIVVFTSDHGYNLGHHGLWHKGNGRWLTVDGVDPSGVYGDTRPNLYDNSMKVPCIIKWPGKISKNTLINQVVSFPDFFPTLLDVTGIEKPEDVLLRGKSILPLIEGHGVETWNDDLYAEYIDLRTYRTKEWKVVLDFSKKGLHELYNLENDPKEHVNLYSSTNVEVIKNKNVLISKLIEKMKSIKDKLLLTKEAQEFI